MMKNTRLSRFSAQKRTTACRTSRPANWQVTRVLTR